MEIKLTPELASQVDPCLTWDNDNGTYGTTLEHIQRMQALGIYVDDEWIVKVKQLANSITYRINKLLPSDRNISSDRFPEDINFNTELTIGLTTKTIDYFGLRVAQVFYQSIDPQTRELIPAIPVVFERYKYTWDEKNKLPLGRVKEIFFYKEDNTLSTEFKLLPKEFYNISDRADIATRRRQTILGWLIARATELGLGTKVKDYFAVYKEQTDKYVLYGDCQILKTVKDSTETWLDLDTTTSLGTIRNAIAVCFTKALEPTSNAEVDMFLSKQ
jgi:hypothetical protein